MNARIIMFSATALSLFTGAASFHSVPARAEGSVIVIAQNDEETGFWGRVFNRSDRSSSAKPLFLDHPASTQGKPYNYNNQTTSNGGMTMSSSSDDPRKIQQERDAAVQKRTDEILRVAAIENARRSAALEKAILESNARAAGEKTENAESGDTNKKMVYDPQKAKTYNPNPAPYTARPRNAAGADPEEQQQTAPTGRLYNAR